MNLRTLLNERNMSMYRLAQISGIPKTTVIDICSGKSSIECCNAKTVYQLARALECTMEYLMQLDQAGYDRISGSLAIGQEVVHDEHLGALRQVLLGHADVVFHPVGEGEYPAFVHIAGHVAGAALLGKHHGDVAAGNGGGQRACDAAGFNGEHQIGLLVAKFGSECLTNFHIQLRIHTVVEKHIHLHNIRTNANAMGAYRFYQLFHGGILLRGSLVWGYCMLVTGELQGENGGGEHPAIELNGGVKVEGYYMRSPSDRSISTQKNTVITEKVVVNTTCAPARSSLPPICWAMG